MIRKPARTQKPSGLPSEAEILDFIRTAPGAAGKRDIARAFSVKGADKIALKQLLKRLADEGKLAKSRKKLIDTSALPPVTVLEVMGLDADGEAWGEPIEWDEANGAKPPRVLVESRATAPRQGDRVLAKIAPAGGGRYKFRGLRHPQARRPRRPRPRRLSHRHGPRRPHRAGRQEGPS